MKIIVLGAPGAGKGTQAHFLALCLGIPHIATGTLLREAAKQSTPEGKALSGLLEKGQLAPNETVIQLLKERLLQPDCQNGFVLDGFPRNAEQAETMERTTGLPDKVVLIHVDDEVIVRRIVDRRMCRVCESSWHLVYHPPAKAGVCDLCGGELVQRVDDKAKTVRERLIIFHREEAPINVFFKEKGLLTVVQGQEKVEDTAEAVLKALQV